jgi:hypothetical protein
VFNWVIQNMMVPGKVETWVIIQDFKDVNSSQIPMKMLKAMGQRLALYFTTKLFRCFSINVPTAINALWTIFKAFVEKDTRKKIIIEKNGWETIVGECISRENLEVKYGGCLPNRENDFYPFHN